MLHRLLIGPMISTVTAAVLYSGFFKANQTLSLGSVTAANFGSRLLIGFLIHTYLNNGYYFLSSKLINEWYGKTLPLAWIAPCRRITLLFGLTSVEMLRCLIISVAILTFLAFQKLPGLATVLVAGGVAVLIFSLGIIFGFLKSCLYLTNEGTSEFLDTAYLGLIFTGCLYIPKTLLPKMLWPLCEINPVYHAGMLLTGIWEGQAIAYHFMFFVASVLFALLATCAVWYSQQDYIMDRSFG